MDSFCRQGHGNWWNYSFCMRVKKRKEECWFELAFLPLKISIFHITIFKGPVKRLSPWFSCNSTSNSYWYFIKYKPHHLPPPLIQYKMGKGKLRVLLKLYNIPSLFWTSTSTTYFIRSSTVSVWFKAAARCRLVAPIYIQNHYNHKVDLWCIDLRITFNFKTVIFLKFFHQKQRWFEKVHQNLKTKFE